MTPAEIDRVFGRGRLRMTTGEHVEVFREEARDGEERRYSKRFLDTAGGDFRPWTEREWRILDRLGARGDAAVARVVRYLPADESGIARLQTRDAGPTVDQWASLVTLRRTAPVLPYAFGDCANWWALARQCLIAFEPLHALGFVHLDFKADNVCVPWKPAHAAQPAAGQPMAPDFEGLALIDVAFSLLPEVELPAALPLARESGFEYQSPRLLDALEDGRRGDLAPTFALDWRCDFFSLAALLWRYLPELEETGGTGWTRERHDAATAFVRQLLEIHGAPLAAERPHRELIVRAALRLAEPQLAAALQAGSSFDPERTWPNGAEATPLTRVVATAPPARGAPRAPGFAARPDAAAAAWATTAVPTATVAATSAATANASMTEPRLDEEVTVPLGAPVDVPLEVDIDTPVDIVVDVPLEAPVARALDVAPEAAVAPTLDVPLDAAVAAAVDVPLQSPVARAVDVPAQARRVDVGFAAPAAHADEAALARSFDGPPRERVGDARSAAPRSPLASAVAGAGMTTRERAASIVTSRSPPAGIGGAPAEPAWPAFAAHEAEPAATPKRTSEPPRLPPPSSVPILAAAGAGAIVLALAAWWQLDGRARFDRGVEHAAAPEAASAAIVAVPPEAIAAESGASAPATDTAPPPSDVISTAAPAPPAAEVASSPTPAAAVPGADSDRSAAAAPDQRAVAPAEFEASAADWMRDRLPRLAQAAERRLAPVLAAAARSPELRRRGEIRAAAQKARADVALPAGFVLHAQEAQDLDAAAQAAYRRDKGVAEALRLQTQAFGANPLDPQIAGNLASLRLKETEKAPEAEPARQLALHALTLKDDRFPTGRIEDWTTLAVAAALAGREADARNAWFVSMALTNDVQQQCDAALAAQATYGAPLKPSVQAMLQRARSSAAYGRCELPHATPTEKRASRNVKSKSTHKPRRPIP